MKTFDGLSLDVRTSGPQDAPLTVLLAHCWTLNQADWSYQVRDLQREFGHGIRIVTWDHRGHGASQESPKADCTVANLARDMADVIEQHAAPGPLVLAGHSIGGMTIMALAEQRPEIFERVVGVALVATSSGRLDTVTLGLPEMGPFLRRQIPRVLAFRSRTLTKRARRRAPIIERRIVRNFLFGRPMRLVDAALTVEGIINSPAATMVGFYENCMEHERTAALKVLDGIPTQVLVGTRDVLTPPEHARRIADAVEGAVLTVIPEAGHMLPLERDEIVSATLVRLVRPHL
ncbi:MAG: alpha/beta fold hydrolase [Nocardioidaceae bacterium]|nr:alpha/beta fold hydrolase [Nocardioidaceae bacterium]